jgi:hypothetical protein
MRVSAVLAAVLLQAALPAAADQPSPAPPPFRPFNLGVHRRAVSTASAEAQKAFDQGLNWTFSFNHGDAERAYREAARLDDGLAIAWWGVALVNGPHINNPMVDEAHAQAAWDALAEAKKRREKASDVEQALIDALGARYASRRTPTWPRFTPSR